MTREGHAAAVIDLSQHVSCWRGHLIPAAFAALVEGIRSEQARLDGKRFLVTLFRQEYDLDGLTEYVDFIEGFDDLAQAGSFADAQAENLSHDGGGKGWPLVECDTLAVLSRVRHPVSTVERVYYRGFEAADGRGFNSIYCHFEVLEVSTDPVLGVPLFSYLNCESELIRYFADIGERSGRA